MKLKVVSAVSICMASILINNLALADNKHPIEEVVIIGTTDDAKAVPGSSYVFDEEALSEFNTTDINQLLKIAPGIYIREEDGFGLRPNIGIRGATSERSEKITLLEDSVLIAPAPYSNPAAYYFPTTMRMNGVEILKGAPLLRHGPQTVGGVINLLSTPIPSTSNFKLAVEVGEDNTQNSHLSYGSSQGQWSWLLETVQRDSDGFKNIDRSSRDTGFDIEDYVAKISWQSADNAVFSQGLLLKLQYSEESSNASYLGLADADFASDPNRRYGISAIDQMNNRHSGFNLSHNISFADSLSVTSTAYHNKFKRDWFKLSGGNALVAAANEGDAEAQGQLDGNIDIAGLKYKHNNRSYESSGLQINVDWQIHNHEVDLGARLHHDEMDRFQPTEVYDQIDGGLVFVALTAATGSNNRLEEADALAIWLSDKWQASDALDITVVARYETFETRRREYSDSARRELAQASKQRRNTSHEFLPGIGLIYALSNEWQLLAGVHKGISPLGGGAKENEKPETSTNWEAGFRFNRNEFSAEMIGFYSDFSNKVENCSVGSPCSNGETSGTYVTGEAVIAGLETQLSYGFSAGNFSLPLSLNYTYTEAEISKDKPTAGTEKGDQLKDIPQHTWSLSLGAEHSNGWNSYLKGKYIHEMCTNTGCNRDSSRFGKTDDLLVFDLISSYSLWDNTTVYLKIDNLFAEQEIISRKPDGARPNKSRTLSLGFTLDI